MLSTLIYYWDDSDFGFSCSYLILNSSTTTGTSYIANIVTDPRIKLQALSLMNEVFKVRMELTTNGVIVRDTLNYVNGKAEKLDQQVKAEEEKEEDSAFDNESESEEEEEAEYRTI
jgi:hypothetical protein